MKPATNLTVPPPKNLTSPPVFAPDTQSLKYLFFTHLESYKDAFSHPTPLSETLPTSFSFLLGLNAPIRTVP